MPPLPVSDQFGENFFSPLPPPRTPAAPYKGFAAALTLMQTLTRLVRRPPSDPSAPQPSRRPANHQPARDRKKRISTEKYSRSYETRTIASIHTVYGHKVYRYHKRCHRARVITIANGRSANTDFPSPSPRYFQRFPSPPVPKQVNRCRHQTESSW